MMKFDVITIFPEIIENYFSAGILKRAVDKKRISLNAVDLRDFTHDKHRTVDDRPYGGGAGMVLRPEPIIKALRKTVGTVPGKIGREARAKRKQRVILLSPRGRQFTQNSAKKLKNYKRIVLICGRYEGVDERVTKFVDETISLGEFVMTGGEIAALAIIDTVTRLLPGVLGNESSSVNESFSSLNYIEHPHYTRPPSLSIGKKKLSVPKVLLSGNHAEIKKWREKHAISAKIKNQKSK